MLFKSNLTRTLPTLPSYLLFQAPESQLKVSHDADQRRGSGGSEGCGAGRGLLVAALVPRGPRGRRRPAVERALSPHTSR